MLPWLQKGENSEDLSKFLYNATKIKREQMNNSNNLLHGIRHSSPLKP
jgi:hypothetical protein